MPKKYTRRRLRNMDQLDLDQERIRNKVKRIEDNWIQTFFNPQQLAISLGSYLLRRKKKSKPSSGQSLYTERKSKNINPAKADHTPFVKRPVVKRVARKIGISFIQWQAFNLALFLGKKIIHNIKNKKKAAAPKIAASRQ